MKPLIVANWKMNPTTLQEAKQLFNSVKKGIKNVKNVEVVICPPFVYLSSFKFQVSSFKLGAQDCFFEEKGAYTGEISPTMLKNLGCQYVIIGHSERRKLGETDEQIFKKIKTAISTKLKPILCIGEREEERKKGKTKIVLKKQLRKSLRDLTTRSLNYLILAYEPVWAIGTGKPCYPPEAKKTLLFLRKIFRKNKILYGGSVNSENAASYIKKANFNGLLIGGASLNPEEFIKIVKNVSRTKAHK